MQFAALLLSAGTGWTTEPADVRAVVQPIHLREPAPAFDLQDETGRRARLSGYSGKVLVLDFWATECGGCIREMPAFTEIERIYRANGLATLGISVDMLYDDLKSTDEAWVKVKSFLRKHRVFYPVAVAGNDVTTRYGIQSLPLTYLIDRRGKIAAIYSGVVDRTDLEQNIRILLRERVRP